MVRLTKIKTIYEDGLEIPVLADEEHYACDPWERGFLAEFRPGCIRLTGSARYMQHETFDLPESEFSLIKEAIRYWRGNKLSWAGIIATGHSWCGHTGYTYYAPNSEKNEWFSKDDFKVERRSEAAIENLFDKAMAKEGLKVRDIVPKKKGRFAKTDKKVISIDYINNEISGVTLELKKGLEAKLESFEIALKRGKKKGFLLCVNDIETLEGFIKLYPKIIKDKRSDR